MSKTVGLLGLNIGYSLSPKLHGAAFKALGLDWDYLLLDTQPEDLNEAVDKLRSKSWIGGNVTVPYKEKILPYLDSLDQTALRLGAVNTIVSEGGLLTGLNTDGHGLGQDLKRLDINLPGKDVTILGAGGAAAAVLAQLDQTNNIRIICRRPETAEWLASRMGIEAKILPWGTIPVTEILFNCTPPQSHWQQHAQKAQVIYDLNYHEENPPQGNYHNGLGMLVFQAAKASELWTKQKPPIEQMAKAVNLKL